MELLYRAAKFASDVLSGFLMIIAVTALIFLTSILMVAPWYIGWQMLDWMFK